MSYIQGASLSIQASNNRKQAQATKEAQDFKLEQAGYSRNPNGGFDKTAGGAADVEQQKRDYQMQELAVQRETIQGLQGQLAADKMDESIMDFVKTGNADVIQNAFDNNPFLKNAWAKKGVMNVANIDFDRDQKILESAGILPDVYNNPDGREVLKKSAWKVHDGEKWVMGGLEQLVSQTGASKRLSIEKNKLLFEHLNNMSASMKGVMGTNEQKKEKLNITREKLGYTKEQLELNKRKHDLDVQELDAKKDQLAYDREHNIGDTRRQKDIIQSRKETKHLISAFGGEDNFDKTDFSLAKNYRKAYKHVIAIEKFEGTDFSSAESKRIGDIRKLIALADPASKISAGSTGFWDNFTNDIGKYLSDNVGGREASDAYQTYKGFLRHALAGSNLTKVEVDFDKLALGTLDQKLGPVLSKFKTSLLGVRAHLDSISRIGNPYVAKVRLGVDLDKLNSIIVSLDERIDSISGQIESNSVNYEPAKDLTSGKPAKDLKGDKPSLDDLYSKFGAK